MSGRGVEIGGKISRFWEPSLSRLTFSGRVLIKSTRRVAGIIYFMKIMGLAGHTPGFPLTFLTRALAVTGLLCLWSPAAQAAIAPPSGGTNSEPVYTALNAWSFRDYTNWTSDSGYSPVSFTNLAFSRLGNGFSLVVDTNVPAWLRYPVYESDGTTNLTVNAGTVAFWVAPASWASTNAGGNGPGESGRLLEVGGYTTNSSFGWWSLYLDSTGNHLYFSAQTNDSSSTYTTYLTCPISWTTNYFHQVVLAYSATNTALYLDGNLATNGSGVTVYPGSQALANGFCIGSATNGLYQANALFNSVVTYSVPMDAGTIQETFNDQYPYYMLNPLNSVMEKLTNALSNPTWTNGYAAIAGAGELQWDGTLSSWVGALTADQVSFANVTALATNGGTSFTFGIQGGQAGYYYDLFAAAELESPLTNADWVWLGQGLAGNVYTVNILSPNVFFILGTPTSACECGLTSAYLALVAKVSPSSSTDAYGVPYAWYAQNGLVPITSALATQDPDGDGLLNYQEYQYGTRPNVSEGFSIWVGAVNGTSAIP
jgi:hypothetical protein